MGTGRNSRRRRGTVALLGAILLVPTAVSAAARPLQVPPPRAALSTWDPFAPNPEVYGATGTVPRQATLDPDVVRKIEHHVSPVAFTRARADLPPGELGIPGRVLDAYHGAEAALAAGEPGCHLPWWLLAGIGKVESNHAEDGAVDADGMTLRPIRGPVLDGTNGTAAIPDTDNGKWDGDTTWDRAVGPMQFLPSTWRRWGTGNPNDVDNAAVGAGRYLCAGGRDLSDTAQLADAVFSYNHSDDYVRLVLAWAHAYESGVRSIPPGDETHASAPATTSAAPTTTTEPAPTKSMPVTPPAMTTTPAGAPEPSTGPSRSVPPVSSSSTTPTEQPTTTDPTATDPATPTESGSATPSGPPA